MDIDRSFSKCRARRVAAVAAWLVAGCSSNGASSPPSAPGSGTSGASSSALDSGPTADASTLGADVDSSLVTSDGATGASVDAGPVPDATGDAGTDGSSEASSLAEAGPSDASAESESNEAGPTPAPMPSAMLSETGLFKSVASDGTLNLQDGVQEYQPMYSLWADGAEKTRWIYLPPGTQIDTTDLDHWSFPAGTKFWKEFALGGQRLETRLLWIYGPGADDFLLVTYWWNPEAGIANDAELANAFGVQNVNGTTHDIPAQEDCHTCHDALEEHVLGFGAIELNHTLPGVNIHTLIDAGSLTNDPDIADLHDPGRFNDASGTRLPARQLRELPQRHAGGDGHPHSGHDLAPVRRCDDCGGHPDLSDVGQRRDHGLHGHCLPHRGTGSDGQLHPAHHVDPRRQRADAAPCHLSRGRRGGGDRQRLDHDVAAAPLSTAPR